MDRYEETSMRHLKVEMTHDFPPSLQHLFPPLTVPRISCTTSHDGHLAPREDASSYTVAL